LATSKGQTPLSRGHRPDDPGSPLTPPGHHLGTRRLSICDTGVITFPSELAIVFLCIINEIMIKDDQGGFMMMFFSHSVVDKGKALLITG
jgi:hypothetical protein